MHCKPTLRHVALFLEGIHTLEYSISALDLSNKPGPPHNPDHLNWCNTGCKNLLFVPSETSQIARINLKSDRIPLKNNSWSLIWRQVVGK